MKRTPRNFDGIAFPGKTIKELLPDALCDIQKRNKGANQDILKAWPKICPQMANLTEAVSFENGVLTVIVKSSTLYSLLCQHEKDRLLLMLQKQFPASQVQKIFFRIG